MGIYNENVHACTRTTTTLPQPTLKTRPMTITARAPDPEKWMRLPPNTANSPAPSNSCSRRSVSLRDKHGRVKERHPNRRNGKAGAGRALESASQGQSLFNVLLNILLHQVACGYKHRHVQQQLWVARRACTKEDRHEHTQVEANARRRLGVTRRPLQK